MLHHGREKIFDIHEPGLSLIALPLCRDDVQAPVASFIQLLSVPIDRFVLLTPGLAGKLTVLVHSLLPLTLSLATDPHPGRGGGGGQAGGGGRGVRLDPSSAIRPSQYCLFYDMSYQYAAALGLCPTG